MDEATDVIGSINFHTIIPCDDGESAKQFYSSLFPNWRFRSQPPNEFWEITGPDGNTPQTAYLAMMKGAGTPKSTTNYYTVDNIQYSIEIALRLGGRLVVPVTPVPGVGYYAELLDVIGNTFGLWQDDTSEQDNDGGPANLT